MQHVDTLTSLSQLLEIHANCKLLLLVLLFLILIFKHFKHLSVNLLMFETHLRAGMDQEMEFVQVAGQELSV